jgi:small subunit ribosomal protein S3
VTVEDRFIKLGLKHVELETFLETELERAGYGGVDVKRVSTGTHVAVYVERPGMVIGKKGKSINQLTDDLQNKFDMDNPQVEVVEIKKPEFCAPIMAKRIKFALERGINVRRAGYMMLRKIMDAGARGVEITIGGKVAGERKKRIRFYQGYLSKTGEPAMKLVSHGFAAANMKAGTIGIKVHIMSSDVVLPDRIDIPDAKVPEEPKVEPPAALAETPATPAEPEKTEETKDGDTESG